jgi:hypothetical protein
MHVGNGDVNFNIIDNEVEKDVVTNYPTINSSGVKGALREFFDNQNIDKACVNEIFGEPNAGKLKFFCADMLAVPMRASSGNEPYYLVSTKTPTRDDLKNGFTETLSDGGTYNQVYDDFSNEYFISTTCAVITLKDNVEYPNGENIFFPKKGVYFANNGNAHTTSFSVNGFSFADTKIKEECLPILEEVGSDTLTWDGDTTNKEPMINGNFYLITDKVPTVNDLSNGFVETMSDGTTYDIISLQSDECIMLNSVAIAMKDNATIPDSPLVCPKKGVYFVNIVGRVHTTSLKINGFAWSTDIKIKSSYIPDDLELISVDDIDAICGGSIEFANMNEGAF